MVYQCFVIPLSLHTLLQDKYFLVSFCNKTRNTAQISLQQAAHNSQEYTACHEGQTPLHGVQNTSPEWICLIMRVWISFWSVQRCMNHCIYTTDIRIHYKRTSSIETHTFCEFLSTVMAAFLAYIPCVCVCVRYLFWLYCFYFTQPQNSCKISSFKYHCGIFTVHVMVLI